MKKKISFIWRILRTVIATPFFMGLGFFSFLLMWLLIKLVFSLFLDVFFPQFAPTLSELVQIGIDVKIACAIGLIIGFISGLSLLGNFELTGASQKDAP